MGVISCNRYSIAKYARKVMKYPPIKKIPWKSNIFIINATTEVEIKIFNSDKPWTNDPYLPFR